MSKTPQQQKNKNTFVFALILIILGAGLVSILVISSAAADTLPDDTTDIGDDDSTDSTVTVWQSLYIKNKDGATPADYWVNAPKPFTLRISGSPTGDEEDLTQMKQMANSIWMQPQTNSIASWTFSCKETIVVTDLDGETVKTIANSATVNANGQSAEQGKNSQITSSWLTDAQLEEIIDLPTGQYYFTVAIGEIMLITENEDGTTNTLTSDVNGTSENVLNWLIEIA